MNQTLSTLNPFAPKGEAQSAARRKITFLVGLSAVLLAVLVAYVAVSGQAANRLWRRRMRPSWPPTQS
jgi:hypothetical protein